MERERVEFLVSQYLDGTLSNEERLALEELAGRDAEVRGMIVEYRKLNDMLRAGGGMPEMRWDRVAGMISEAVKRGEAVGREEMVEQAVDEPLEYSITQYIDGELSGDEREAVEKAIASNPAARRVYDEHRTLNGIVRDAWPMPTVRWEKLAERISEAVEDLAAPSISIRFLRLAPRLAMAACVLIVMGIAIWAMKDRSRDGGEVGVVRLAEVSGPSGEAPAGAAVVEISVRPSEDYLSGAEEPMGSPIVFVPSRVEIAADVDMKARGEGLWPY